MSTMKDVELYFVPTSFYSQKARLALEEKAIKYKETFVSLFENEQDQAWYLKLNPNGEVPTLRIGDQCYSESEKIIDIVDELPSSINDKLVPLSDSSVGKQVTFWRQKLDEIKIGMVTFGTTVFPEFSVDRISRGMPIPDAQGVRARFQRGVDGSEKMKLKHPELKESYERKVALNKQRLADFFDKEKVTSVFESTDAIMAEIEDQLSKVASVRASMGETEYFLCGRTFTAADLTLCVLLGRFRMVGVLPRFADPKKYPYLDTYWQQVQKRSSVQKVVINNEPETMRFLMRRKIRRYAGGAAIVGVVGVAVWLAYRHLKK